MTSRPPPEMPHDGAVYKTLLESTRAIPWRIEWATQRFTYIGPQIEALLGWAPDSWKTVEDWASRMHPDDRDYVVSFCVSQSQSGVDHEADYRALTRDGGYVWIRDVVHVVRRPDGSVEALVGFMFDISERKKSEQELLRLQRELEALSYKDGLTGVANRRMFDTLFEREWASACREQRPLSLVLIDIDHFKDFNDCYGHLAGDDCLKHVARILGDAVVRPRDLVARYGGEEFALVLPETELEGAMRVASRSEELVRAARIPHERAREGHLTVSQGVGSIVPRPGDEPRRFLETVDRLLYRAKEQGRNRIAR